MPGTVVEELPEGTDRQKANFARFRCLRSCGVSYEYLKKQVYQTGPDVIDGEPQAVHTRCDSMWLWELRKRGSTCGTLIPGVAVEKVTINIATLLPF